LSYTGARWMVDFLAELGVQYLFGNPGTTELPINDAILSCPVRYVLGLQEIPVMAMADGYAQASGTVAVVNLHISCGLGNAMGMLYNAFRAGTPLVVTAGQQDQRFIHTEPILWGEMVSVVRPWTKWAAEVRSVRELPRLLARAIQIAQTPPTGPVFLSLPLDVQTAEMPEDVVCPKPKTLHLAGLPSQEVFQRAASVLAGAKNPGILVGSKPLGRQGIEFLTRLADNLGAPVFHEPYYTHGRCNFPAGHPLSAGLLPFWSPEIRERLESFDVLLAIGIKLFEEYIYHGDISCIPSSTRLIHLDDDPREINKNYPAEIGLAGNIPKMLEAITKELEADPAFPKAEALARRSRWVQEIERARSQLRNQARTEFPLRPMTPLAMLEALAAVLPPNVAVVEEAPTTSGSYFERTGTLPTPEGFFAQRGWALGWGLGCAIGIRLAWPDRPVLALLGDGSALYGIQGLWTAAHYRIPVTFVIANNCQYAILKNCARVLRLPEALQGRFEAVDLSPPSIDYVGLAKSFGVQAARADSPESLSELARESFRSQYPMVIEVPLESSAGRAQLG
jgi:benzoylformate decarboxylase